VCSYIQKNRNRINSIVTADFATLYTKLPHSLIKESVIEILRFCNNNSKKKQYAYNKFTGTCYYADQGERKKGYNYYSLREMIETLEFIIDENWLNLMGTLFLQKCGAPIGANASPMLADLTLSWLEYSYFKENPLPRGAVLFRYIDDVLSINLPNFMDISRDIYGPDLPVERTNSHNSKGDYLDLEIIIENNITMIKMFDKTRAFNFNVLKFPHPNSMIATNILSNCLNGHLIRTLRICTEINDFIEETRSIIGIMRNKEVNEIKIHKNLLRFIHSKQNDLQKYRLFNKKEIIGRIYIKLFN
jgi:hypothetical protein